MKMTYAQVKFQVEAETRAEVELFRSTVRTFCETENLECGGSADLIDGTTASLYIYYDGFPVSTDAMKRMAKVLSLIAGLIEPATAPSPTPCSGCESPCDSKGDLLSPFGRGGAFDCP
jgi:hypothetical protein